MSTIGSKIAFYRKAKGMTQEDLAVNLEVSAQAVSKWENDIACPDIQLLAPLSKLFAVTTDELLSVEPVRSVQLLPAEERSKIEGLTFRIIVDSKEGDRVRINVPMELIKIALEIGMKIPQVAEVDYLKNIDLKQILSIVERGVIGNLVEVETAKGENVRIVVE